jgi:hypothetical protein
MKYKPAEGAVSEIYSIAKTLESYAERLETVRNNIGTFSGLAGFKSGIASRSNSVYNAASALVVYGDALDNARIGYLIAEQKAYQLLSGDTSFNIGDGVKAVAAPTIVGTKNSWWDRIIGGIGNIINIGIGAIKVGAETIAGWWNTLKDWLGGLFRPKPKEPVNPTHSTGKAYDDDGSYGGNQGSMGGDSRIAFSIEDFQRLAPIVRKYFPNESDKEIRAYLKDFNGYGCSYVAVSNTIFAQFEGREAEFERRFGFPMYITDSNGNKDLNFNAVIIDFYSSKGKIGAGTSIDGKEIERMWEQYMGDHQISVNVQKITAPTPSNYAQIAEKGEVTIIMSPLCLIREDGSKDTREGGHAVVITGVTEEGLFIVSSWGKKHYVDPKKDANKLTYQQVAYK